MSRRLILATLLGALLCLDTVCLAQSAAVPGVERFTPEGRASQVRQVAVRFTDPMVALGDPRLPDPFDIKCDAPGSGRWADTRNWVYDFDADLPAGLACRFALRKALATQGGVPLGGKQVFAFTTGGPSILRSLPSDGTFGVDEEQVFLLKLDAPATAQSVQQHARCAVSGVGEEIPVEVLGGEARAAILKQRRELGYQYFQLLWKNGLVSDVRVRDREFEHGEASVTVLHCQRRLPPGSQVSLLWGAGIRSASGIARDTEQKLAFKVRTAFTAQAECTRTNARAGCLPMLPIGLRFSAPVPRAIALGVRLRLASGKLLGPISPGTAEGDMLQGIDFAPAFPEQQVVRIQLPPGFVDDSGRTLQNAARFPLEVRVDEAPPLAKFSGAFGILEAKEGGVLPVTLRNVEPSLTVRQAALPAKLLHLTNDPVQIASWLRRVEQAGQSRGEMVAVPKAEQDPAAAKPKLGTDEEDEEGDSDPTHRWREDTGNRSVFASTEVTRTFSIPKPAGRKPFEVVGIPLKEPGFYVVEIESRILGQSLLGRDESRYVATSALVTDLAVHFKWGRTASIVWVTHLHDGTPASGAAVSILNYCNGSVLWQGTTGSDGLASVPKSLGSPHGGAVCSSWAPAPLIVAAKTDADLGFTLSGWDQGIEPGQFNLPLGNEYQSRIYHTVLDRMLFRAGETVSMKHFMRHHEIEGFTQMGGVPGKRSVVLEHQGSGQKYTLEATFDRDGVAEGDWKIPAEAKLGEYSISILDGGVPAQSGTFRVEQFRLPSMRAQVTGSAAPLVQPKTADIDLHVAYMAGGGAGGLAVKLRTLVESRRLQYPGYLDYQFGGKPVVEGVVRNDSGPQDYDFEGESDGEADTGLAAASTQSKTQVLPLTLDAAGSARVTVPSLPVLEGAATLTAELEYADANGEILTSSGHVQLLPADVSVGIRREGWAGSRDQVRFRVVVLDLKGQPVARRALKVAVYQASRYSFRKRLIGGFYAYESSTETKKLGASCQGETDAQGLLTCEVAPGVTGEVLIRADTTDSAGRTTGATTSVWVYSGEQTWFGGTSGDRMDLLPEKQAYEAGETARLQVRMPFREATALVTVERQGVMSSFVTHIDAREPVVQVPIAGNFAPNAFISVLAVRGRVPHAEKATRGNKGEEITALVDLNKPAYRLGIAAVRVGWKPHRLDVAVSTEKPTYKVRDQAQVKIHVVRADGGALPAGTEVAVAAVDGALLELAPNPSWDLLASMMGERGLEVMTSTAQMQVVGKRHYGRKAVPSGGGGGRDRTRELFDSLLYWKGRIVLDGKGEAVVSVPLNDSLSEFRIVAVANGGAGFFGTGSTSLNTTQDLILLSGLPPLVREGDQYLATFTLRNTSDHALSAEVSGSKLGPSAQPLAKQVVEVGAGQSRDIAWRVTAPVGASTLKWEVQAQAVGGTASDKLRITETVIPAFPVRTYQATITQLSEPYSVAVEKPAGAIAGRGGLELTLRSRLGDGLEGVHEYLRLYPYVCIEQQVSQAIGLRDTAMWNHVMARLPAYQDGDGLLRYFPTDNLPGDDSLTAYVLQIAQEAGWTLPEGSQERMLGALKRFVQGRLVRWSALPTADLTIRKLAAIEALARYGQADSSMLESLAIEPEHWPTSAVLDWIGIARRLGAPESPSQLKAALQILRTRLNFQGTVMTLSTERSDALWWLMISTDSNANRLALAVLEQPEWHEDMPRVVRGALSRQRSGHWNTTVANAWGVLAMEKFSARFESEAVSGTTTVHYGATTRPATWPADRKVNEVDLPWQEGPGKVDVTHAGTGKPWAMLRATAALPLNQPLSSGYRIRRVITPIEQKTPGHWSRGDVLRVRLELEAQSDMSWVVVDDPIPGGASILGTGLGGQSKLLARNERREGWAWPAFEERRFDAFRTYYRFVPKGAWAVEYTVRLNNPGTFLQPATRVEAMYAPEMLGELPNAAVVVEP